MSNKFRLTSNAFNREEPSKKPKKIIWLSVEGSRTEIDYFKFIEKYKSQLNIDVAIQIETLKRCDDNSDPESVLNLLDEYIMLRDNCINDDIFEISEIVNCFGIEKIKQYLTDKTKLAKADALAIHTDLDAIKFDVEYRKYLKACSNKDDEFGIVIDTEGKDNNGRREQVTHAIKNCKKNKYKCYLSNPCFEFFLLLHTYNPIKEYEQEKDDFENNIKVSAKHTYMSKLLSARNGHTKRITEPVFNQKYLNNISAAIKNSKTWAHTLDTVQDAVGTNMCDFFELVGFKQN